MDLTERSAFVLISDAFWKTVHITTSFAFNRMHAERDDLIMIVLRGTRERVE